MTKWECTPFVKPLELCRTSCLTLMAQTTLLAKLCFFWIINQLCGNFIWTRWAQIKIWTQTKRYTLFPVISVLLRWRKLSLARVLKWKYGIEGRGGACVGGCIHSNYSYEVVRNMSISATASSEPGDLGLWWDASR